jgi:S-DNA-T family DNA segregation ATPase FtsK/SpoIIIE
VIVVIEGVSDFANGESDLALQELAKAVIATDGLLLCEAEVSTMGATFGLPALAKSSRCGLALQPDQMDGTAVFRTQFPRINRADYPQGRALLVGRGTTQTIQVALPPVDSRVGNSPHSPDVDSLIPSQ